MQRAGKKHGKPLDLFQRFSLLSTLSPPAQFCFYHTLKAKYNYVEIPKLVQSHKQEAALKYRGLAKHNEKPQRRREGSLGQEARQTLKPSGCNISTTLSLSVFHKEKVMNRNALEAKETKIKKEWNEEPLPPKKAKELNLAVPTWQQSSQGKCKLPNLAQKYCDLWQWLFHNLQPQG